MAEEQGNAAIPLVEERVVTSKRLVETGRVRVQTVVDEREDMVREQLGRVEVDVERVPVNQEVDEVPPVREDGDVTIIPVVEEVLVVTKKLMLVEEVHLHRTHSTEQHTQPVTLAVQRAEIEREDSGGGHS